jgi:hypothetical protein
LVEGDVSIRTVIVTALGHKEIKKFPDLAKTYATVDIFTLEDLAKAPLEVIEKLSEGPLNGVVVDLSKTLLAAYGRENEHLKEKPPPR